MIYAILFIYSNVFYYLIIVVLEVVISFIFISKSQISFGLKAKLKDFSLLAKMISSLKSKKKYA